MLATFLPSIKNALLWITVGINHSKPVFIKWMVNSTNNLLSLRDVKALSFTLDGIPFAEVMFLYALRKKLHSTYTPKKYQEKNFSRERK